MKSFSSRKLVIGATGLVLLGGAGGALAVAATQGSGGSSRQAYIDGVAKRLNVSPSALRAAMTAAMSEQIEAAVAAGRISQAQAEALKRRSQRSGGVSFFGHVFGRVGPGARGGFGAGSAAASAYLGISAATLRSELEAGKSLTQIASSTPGKSVEGLKAAIVAAEKARLAKALSSGVITSQREQKRLQDLSSRIEALVQRVGVRGPHGRSGLGPLSGRQRGYPPLRRRAPAAP